MPLTGKVVLIGLQHVIAEEVRRLVGTAQVGDEADQAEGDAEDAWKGKIGIFFQNLLKFSTDH